ncbi:kinesin-domain-containing protein [Piromyces finnis]|uniref:Kinesin-like protein n=1 Tax=Piromyces finnis TaxID=1754191 RepID=A0A1Y1VBQ6_9FUNG|nr:kinesin-domain-containing protein [Piromyces finnis]|eukprot:ORX51143.1 kinesin-domain-containing protein [Piromyces finnis]
MVFQIVGIPIATSVLKGYNGTIFAYGQTGTGKTYTMQGPFYSHEDPNFDNGDVYSEKQYLGLIPRIISYIFAQLSREAERNTKDDKKSSPVKYLCQASYYEIYNEQIFDLLTEGSDEPLNIHEDIKRGVFIDRLTTRSISTAEEAYKILEIGAWKRSTASTRMNTQSSRSHSVFTLTLQSKIEKDGITQIQESKLNLVDLAGSERQKLTGTTGQRLLEARNINKSLSALGQVIQSLVDMNNNKKKVHVGYRNSKLTFLLKDSLGGNSKTFLIANISPSTFSLAETLSTLRFAQCTKQVTNKAVVNQV